MKAFISMIGLTVVSVLVLLTGVLLMCFESTAFLFPFLLTVCLLGGVGTLVFAILTPVMYIYFVTR